MRIEIHPSGQPKGSALPALFLAGGTSGSKAESDRSGAQPDKSLPLVAVRINASPKAPSPIQILVSAEAFHCF